MPSSGYNTHTFSAGEVPTTTIWNYLWSNDASFNNGNGFNDAIIINRHLATAAVTGGNFSPTYFTGTMSNPPSSAEAIVATITIPSTPYASRLFFWVSATINPNSTAAPVWVMYLSLRETNLAGSLLDQALLTKDSAAGVPAYNNATMLSIQALASSTAKTYVITLAADANTPTFLYSKYLVMQTSQ